MKNECEKGVVELINILQEKIKEIESNDLLSYPTATIFENAPLAMTQLSLKAKADILKWVLSVIDDICNRKQDV